MDEDKSKARADESKEEEKQLYEERLDDLYAKEHLSKEELDLYFKKLVERNKYMKRLSNRSRTSKYSDKLFLPSIGQKSLKEHVMKSIERKVMEMSKNGEELKADIDPNAEYGPEVARTTAEQADDDYAAKVSLRSGKMSIKSKISPTIPGTKSMKDTKAGNKSATITKPITDEDKYKKVRKIMANSKELDFGKRYIDNIMGADIPRTGSDGNSKLEANIDTPSQIEVDSYVSLDDVSRGPKSSYISDTESDEQNISELNCKS